MPLTILARPATSEYASYYTKYITLVPAGDLVAHLQDQVKAMQDSFGRVDEARGGYRYAPGKWSIREVIGHLIDTERVFTYRATSFARGDEHQLPSFDQDTWVAPGEFDDRTVASLVDEFTAQRAATIALVRGLPASALQRTGIASGVSFTVLAALHIPPGHLAYHLEHARTHYGVG